MFIELTYFKRDSAYPNQSKGTDKKFLLKADCIEELTEYGGDDRNTVYHTKITVSGGRTINVAENITRIVDLIDATKKRGLI